MTLFFVADYYCFVTYLIGLVILLSGQESWQFSNIINKRGNEITKDLLT